MAPILLVPIETYKLPSLPKPTETPYRHRQVNWKFSPVQSPHHGGLWEANVREMKRCLKIIGQAKLDIEALTTVLGEASLNSRPIAPLDAMPDNGCQVLTPGNFITGRPLQAVPEADINFTNKYLKRWNLVQRLSTELRLRWQQDYLRLYQKSSKSLPIYKWET